MRLLPPFGDHTWSSGGISRPEDGSCSGLSFQVIQPEEQESVKGPLREILGSRQGETVRRKRVLGSEVLAPVPRGAQDRSKEKEVAVMPMDGHLPAAKLHWENTHCLGADTSCLGSW